MRDDAAYLLDILIAARDARNFLRPDSGAIRGKQAASECRHQDDRDHRGGCGANIERDKDNAYENPMGGDHRYAAPPRSRVL